MISNVAYRIVVAGSEVYRYCLAWWDGAVEWFYVHTHREENE